MNDTIIPATAVILAGGKSTRMGTDKAGLDFGGIPLGLHVARRISPWFDELLVSSNSAGPFETSGLRVVPDAVPGLGARGGLLSSMAAAAHPWVFALGCDMPFVGRELVFLLWSLRQGFDAVVPLRRGLHEPLCAFYSTACAKPLESLSGGRGGLHSVFPLVRTREVAEKEWLAADPGGDSFLNLNTPQELEAALRRWKRRL